MIIYRVLIVAKRQQYTCFIIPNAFSTYRSIRRLVYGTIHDVRRLKDDKNACFLIVFQLWFWTSKIMFVPLFPMCFHYLISLLGYNIMPWYVKSNKRVLFNFVIIMMCVRFVCVLSVLGKTGIVFVEKSKRGKKAKSSVFQWFAFRSSKKRTPYMSVYVLIRYL